MKFISKFTTLAFTALAMVSCGQREASDNKSPSVGELSQIDMCKTEVELGEPVLGMGQLAEAPVQENEAPVCPNTQDKGE